MMHSYGWDHMDSGSWLGMTVMFVFAVVVLLIATYIVVRLLVNSWPRERESADRDHALEILRERFARGEINNEEYQKVRETLDRTGRNRAAGPG